MQEGKKQNKEGQASGQQSIYLDLFAFMREVVLQNV
jgi:hypothetical protein